MYDPIKIANWFIERHQSESKTFSLMQILKLAYFAHGFNLAVNKQPLSNEPVEAWAFGPVFPKIYFSFRQQGYMEITKLQLSSDEAQFTQNEEKVLEIVYQIYGGYSGFDLSALTHQKETPWYKTVEGKWKQNKPISEENIKQYFEELLKEAKKSQY